MTDSGLVMIAENGYNALDTARCMKVFYLWDDWLDIDLHNLDTTSVRCRIVPVYETFFEKSIEVEGEFIVSATNNHSILDLETHTFHGYDVMPITISTKTINNPNCWTQHYYYKILHGDGRWLYRDKGDLFCIFPIIDTTGSYRVPDSCKGVRNFGMPYQDSNYAYLTWDRGRFNQTWQVAYGPAEDSVESYTVEPCTTESFMLRGLTPGVEYAARVRGTCFEGEAFSEWSDTVRFVRHTGTEGIASQLTPYISLSPNPASSRVVVASSAALRRVTLYDLQGHAVYDQDATGFTVEIDVQSLSSGLYIVAVITSQGLITQKLTIE